MLKKIILPTFLALTALPTTAAISSDDQKAAQPWRLAAFVETAQSNPTKLLRIANALFSPMRIARVSADSSLAFEWQDRLAMVSALSTFFDPTFAKHINSKQLGHARRLISHALHKDPALFVRDGAVEAIRRIVRMQPADTLAWRSDLELAFLDPKNVLDSEGLFIRETILTAMREGNLRPSALIVKAAKRDKNPNVKNYLKLWDTAAFENAR
jgi:hypothetical protein